jgi:two-component system cell cycle response regulator DivK
MTNTLDRVSVLVIEDDENSLLVTQRLLRLAGVKHIASYRSGAEALAGLGQAVDLALVDIQLGNEDGYHLLKELRHDTRLAGAKMVALTANVLPQDVQRAHAAGFDGLIGKPLNFERFADQIRRVLEGQSVWQTR